MKTASATLVALVVAAALIAAQGRIARTLDVYLIDVEGATRRCS